MARTRRGSRRSTSKTTTIKPRRKGQKKITFKAGGLHRSTGTPKGKKIPASKHRAAAAGKLGPKAKKQELFYRNVLKGRGRRKKGR